MDNQTLLACIENVSPPASLEAAVISLNLSEHEHSTDESCEDGSRGSPMWEGTAIIPFFKVTIIGRQAMGTPLTCMARPAQKAAPYAPCASGIRPTQSDRRPCFRCVQLSCFIHRLGKVHRRNRRPGATQVSWVVKANLATSNTAQMLQVCILTVFLWQSRAWRRSVHCAC